MGNGRGTNGWWTRARGRACCYAWVLFMVVDAGGCVGIVNVDDTGSRSPVTAVFVNLRCCGGM